MRNLIIVFKIAEKVRNERFQNGWIGEISHLFVKTKVRYELKGEKSYVSF